jgi:hypothetical protein
MRGIRKVKRGTGNVIRITMAGLHAETERGRAAMRCLSKLFR